MSAGIVKLYHSDNLVDTRTFYNKLGRKKIIEEWYKLYRLDKIHGCYIDIELTSLSRMPTIINTETNETFFSVVHAAKSANISQNTLWYNLNRGIKNSTIFRFIDRQKFERSGVPTGVEPVPTIYSNQHIYITS